MNTPNVLIDSKEHYVDEHGYVYCMNLGKKVPCSYHSALIGNKRQIENVKVVTGGHLYVMNYNPQTYIQQGARNFNEYTEYGWDGPPRNENA